MAATVTLQKTYDSGGATYVDVTTGSTVTHTIDYLDDDVATLIATSSLAVLREDVYSYPLWLIWNCTGTFSSIYDFKVWASSLSELTTYGGTGAAITASVQTTYSAPTSNAVTGDSAIPTTYGAALDVSQAGAGTIYDGTVGRTKWIRTQLKLGSTDATIRVNTQLMTFNWQWSEL